MLAPLARLGRDQQTRQLAWVRPPTLTDLPDLPGDLLQNGTVGGLLVGLAAVGLATRGRRGVVLGACVLLPTALLYVGGLFTPLWVPRYLLFTVPFACLLAAAPLAPGPPVPAPPGPPAAGAPVPGPPVPAPPGPPAVGPLVSLRLRWALSIVAVAGLLGAPAQAGLRRTHETPRSAPIDYPAATRIIDAQRRPGDGIIYSPRDMRGFLDVAVAYYLGDRQPRDVLLVRGPVADASLAATECPRPADCLSGVDRLWLLTRGNHPTNPLSGATPAKAAALRDTFRIERTWTVPGLTLTLLTR